MASAEVEAIILQLKEEALAAAQRTDGELYSVYLADNAVAVVPSGMYDKEAIVRMMAPGNSRFKSLRIEDTRAFAPTPNSGIVTYKAIFEGAPHDDTAKGVPGAGSMYVSTVYAQVDGEWKGIFYQETPLQGTSR